MNNLIFFESGEQHDNLLPISYTRPIADFRIGILTIREKWERYLDGEGSYIADASLAMLFPAEYAADNIYINAAVLPDFPLIAQIQALGAGEALIAEGKLVAARGSEAQWASGVWKEMECASEVRMIKFVYDIFLRNGEEIRADYRLIVAGRKSAPLGVGTLVIGDCEDADGMPLVFLEDGAKVDGATINTTGGPVYVGRDGKICEGACVRGPLAVCGNSSVNMCAKVYPDTTVGPFSKVGGELNNVVIFGYSNKAHDGYLGNAVIGEWCNIGAGTNASNLKNDYSKIRVWNYARRSFMRTDLQFCGLIMGDHSKIGISVMLNTATVIGVGVNLHGSGYPRTFIPSFQEGSPTAGFKDVALDKFFQIAERVMERRGKELTEKDKELFEHVQTIASSFK